MSALKESIIEKLDGLPEPALKQVMDYLVFLKWHGSGDEPSLLSIAGTFLREKLVSILRFTSFAM